MEPFLVLLVVAILICLGLDFLRKGLSTGSKKRPSESTTRPSSPEQDIVERNSGWLEERWNAAKWEKSKGEFKSIPEWFFDSVTPPQEHRLNVLGIEVSGRRLTKGEASDLIGLFEPVSDEDTKILRFFNVSSKGMNQSRARHEAGKLLSDPNKKATWEARPASAMEREFFRFFAIRAPSGLTHKVACGHIEKCRQKLRDKGSRKLQEWDLYEELFHEINDPDFREQHDLRKVSLSVYRSAIQQLKKEGVRLADLSTDPDLVAEKIVEIGLSSEV